MQIHDYWELHPTRGEKQDHEQADLWPWGGSVEVSTSCSFWKVIVYFWHRNNKPLFVLFFVCDLWYFELFWPLQWKNRNLLLACKLFFCFQLLYIPCKKKCFLLSRSGCKMYFRVSPPLLSLFSTQQITADAEKADICSWIQATHQPIRTSCHNNGGSAQIQGKFTFV